MKRSVDAPGPERTEIQRSILESLNQMESRLMILSQNEQVVNLLGTVRTIKSIVGENREKHLDQVASFVQILKVRIEEQEQALLE